MELSRRRALAGGLAVIASPAILMRSAFAADFRLKYAHNLPATHPMHLRATEAVELIRTRTDGRVQIDIFPNNQLGGDTDMLSQLRSGGIDFFTLSGLILANLVPTTAINGVAFAFKDYDAVWKAMDGPTGSYVRKQIEGAGLVVMDRMWDSGFRQMISTSNPIRSPEDLVGMKVRVPVSPLWTSLFKAFDSAPTSINFNEVYGALQTRLVNATDNPISVIDLAKLYEVTKFCTLTNHMWDGFHFLANRRSWERLPAETRAIVSTAWNDAALLQRRDVALAEAAVRGELEKKGLVFNQVDTAPFKDKLRSAGFYSEWKGKFGADAWAALEQSVGTLS